MKNISSAFYDRTRILIHIIHNLTKAPGENKIIYGLSTYHIFDDFPSHKNHSVTSKSIRKYSFIYSFMFGDIAKSSPGRICSDLLNCSERRCKLLREAYSHNPQVSHQQPK